MGKQRLSKAEVIFEKVNTKVLAINSVDVTATAAELNKMDGVTATAAELSLTKQAKAEGSHASYYWMGTYDFAVDGGAISDITIGPNIPVGAVILDGFVDVETTCTTAGADAGTMALKVESANDVVSAIAVSNGANPWDAGRHDIVPVGSAATSIKVATAAKPVTASIATQAFTAGKFHVYLRYVL